MIPVRGLRTTCVSSNTWRRNSRSCQSSAMRGSVPAAWSRARARLGPSFALTSRLSPPEPTGCTTANAAASGWKSVSARSSARTAEVAGIARTPEPRRARVVAHHCVTSAADRSWAVFPAGSPGEYDLPRELTLVLARGEGATVWDTDGRAFTDFTMGWGSVILGHAHPAIVEAVRRRAALGSNFAYVTDASLELAEELARAVPCAERLRFCASGTEATAYAARLARAYTGRSRVLKFEGAYHGANEVGTVSLFPRRLLAFPQGEPTSAGVPASAVDDVLVAPYNDLAQDHGDPRGPSRRRRRHHRRAAPSLHAAPARVPRGPARAHGRARRALDLRRDRDGIPPRVRRRAGVLRRAAGPGDLRQGARRRLSDRRRGGPGRRARPRARRSARPGSLRVVRIEHRGQSGLRRGGGRHPGRAAARGHVSAPLRARRVAARRARRGAEAGRRHRRRFRATVRSRRSCSPITRSSTTGPRSTPTGHAPAPSCWASSGAASS